MQTLQVTVWESAWTSLSQTTFPSLPPLAMVRILFCYLNYPAFCCVLEVVCAVYHSALGASFLSALGPCSLAFPGTVVWGREYPWQMLPSSGHCVSVLTDYQ